MKRMTAFLLCCMMLLIPITSVTAEGRNYELWTQSPCITTGVTPNDMLLYKASKSSEFDLFRLTALGGRYYLGVLETKTSSGGYKGNSKTSSLDFYIILVTDDDYLIVSRQTTGEEYGWDKGISIVDLSSEIQTEYYQKNGFECPKYVICPKNKYTHSGVEEYDEYFFITDAGNIYRTSESAEEGCEGVPMLYNGILYRAHSRYSYQSRSRTYYEYYYMDGTKTKAYQYYPYHFAHNALTMGAAQKVAVSDATVENGYKQYAEGFTSNISAEQYYALPDSDGMYVKLRYPYVISGERTYYADVIEVYRSDRKVMQPIQNKMFETANTTAANYTIKNISGLDESFYASFGVSCPEILIGEKYVILADGTICELSDPNGYEEWHIGTYNHTLAVIGTKKNDAGLWRQWVCPVYFDSRGQLYAMDAVEQLFKTEAPEGQNGYFSDRSTWVAAEFNGCPSVSVSAWWGKEYTNQFPDGRSVQVGWNGMGNGLSELWYYIYGRDGSMLSTGPTGYSEAFANSFSKYKLAAFAINDSKFIVTTMNTNVGFLQEYYRISKAFEDENGEVQSGGIGNKNLTPPEETDTEPVERLIDFSRDDLPIGYNIKDNVIGSEKLDGELRGRINTLCLQDIVILQQKGAIGGNRNTGITLLNFDSYESNMGSDIRFYTNGQYLNWYCREPEKLTEGTYPLSFSIGGQTIYVTVRVVVPPSNDAVTTVVF